MHTTRTFLDRTELARARNAFPASPPPVERTTPRPAQLPSALLAALPVPVLPAPRGDPMNRGDGGLIVSAVVAIVVLAWKATR